MTDWIRIDDNGNLIYADNKIRISENNYLIRPTLPSFISSGYITYGNKLIDVQINENSEEIKELMKQGKSINEIKDDLMKEKGLQYE